MRSVLDPKLFVARDPDGSWEVALREDLRTLPEPERLSFLADVPAFQEKAGLSKRMWFDMARAVLHKSKSYDDLLRRGLDCANASTIRDWLMVCGQRLGVSRTLRVLEDEESGCPVGVEMAEYWLMGLTRTEDEQRRVSSFLNEPSRVARRNRRRGRSP
jgi:hypothetical protein